MKKRDFFFRSRPFRLSLRVGAIPREALYLFTCGNKRPERTRTTRNGTKEWTYRRERSRGVALL